MYAEMPTTSPRTAALGALDVCGAPAWMAHLAQPEMKVVVLGAGGKSGMLACCSGGSERRGLRAGVWGSAGRRTRLEAAKEAGAEAVAVDCTDPIAVMEAVAARVRGRARPTSSSSARTSPGAKAERSWRCSDEGRVVFFSMATSF